MNLLRFLNTPFMTVSILNDLNHMFLTMNIVAGRVPTRVVGIVGIGHCPGISRIWGTVPESAIPPLLM